MSFLKITDPEKRDIIVQEYLKTKRNIQQSNLAERLHDIDTKRDLAKFFKPVVESQKESTKNIVDELTPIREGIKEIPKAITFSQFPSITGYEDQPTASQESSFLGPIAEKYLRKFTNKDEADKTFGLYDKFSNFYIGNKQVEVVDDNIIIGDKEYQGTPGLWELLISKTPSSDIYTEKDYDNYAEIMIKTNAMRKNNDPNEQKPKASRSWKWNNIMKRIWDHKEEYDGSGVIVLPSDPNALLERVDLLMASKKAGNTGVKNEIVSIWDELLRQHIIDKNSFKKIMLKI